MLLLSILLTVPAHDNLVVMAILLSWPLAAMSADKTYRNGTLKVNTKTVTAPPRVYAGWLSCHIAALQYHLTSGRLGTGTEVYWLYTPRGLVYPDDGIFK